MTGLGQPCYTALTFSDIIYLIFGVNVGSSLHQQFHTLTESMPGNLVKSGVAILTVWNTKRTFHFNPHLTQEVIF